MPDPALSEAIQEAYANAPSDAIILHTLELRHPDFRDDAGNATAIRVVRDQVDLTARLEADAPLNAGQMVTFIAMGFDLDLPPVDTAPVPEIVVTLDNVSHIVLTDSGGIQEEAPSLGKPVLVMRDVTERPEAVDAGTVILVGANHPKRYSLALSSTQVFRELVRNQSPLHHHFKSGACSSAQVRKTWALFFCAHGRGAA